MHTKKTWESVLVARPTSEGSRIARCSRTSNAEAHAVMVNTTNGMGLPILRTTAYSNGLYITIPRGIYYCLIPDYILKFARFPDVRNKR